MLPLVLCNKAVARNWSLCRGPFHMNFLRHLARRGQCPWHSTEADDVGSSAAPKHRLQWQVIRLGKIECSIKPRRVHVEAAARSPRQAISLPSWNEAAHGAVGKVSIARACEDQHAQTDLHNAPLTPNRAVRPRMLPFFVGLFLSFEIFYRFYRFDCTRVPPVLPPLLCEPWGRHLCRTEAQGRSRRQQVVHKVSPAKQ